MSNKKNEITMLLWVWIGLLQSACREDILVSLANQSCLPNSEADQCREVANQGSNYPVEVNWVVLGEALI